VVLAVTVKAKNLAGLASIRDVNGWAVEAREIESWAADLGEVVDWRTGEHAIARIRYLRASTFEIDDEVLATLFALRFG
jgi:hypothetical protein